MAAGPVLVVDFGAQYAQLIARRVREANVYSELVPHSMPVDEMLAKDPQAIILSGGPASVFEPGAPRVDKKLFDAGVPVLGICYGFQAMAYALGADVDKAALGEYGKTETTIDKAEGLLDGSPAEQSTWMSHGVAVKTAPEGFEVLAHTEGAPVAAMQDESRKLYGVQWHPEVKHTPMGQKLIENFLHKCAGLGDNWNASNIIDDQVTKIREKVGDAQVICGLSGGVDSGYITACLMPDETFSVGFASPDGTHKFDETTEAGELSQKLGIKNYREMLTKEQCLDAFADIQYHMDEPQSNPSSVPLYFLCQLARQHVTVVLSGEGADEIYAGYEWYADTPLMQKYKHIPAPLRHLASDASQHLPYFKGHDFIIKGSGRPEDWFIGQAHVFEEKDAYDILRPKYRVGPTAREVAAPIYDRVKDLSELEKKQYLDLNLWLPGDILLKADKMSMAHSLELRVPYLDREVLREAQTYPDSYKLRGDTKAVLRTAANKTLPDAWANRTKKGFPVPIAKWLEDPAFSAKVRKSFMSDVAAEYFDQDKLVAMLADPKHERRKIWTAYTFLTWHEQFFEKFDA
jgi:GMP synthase (glutamine-hydrolysing) A subunit